MIYKLEYECDFCGCVNKHSESTILNDMEFIEPAHVCANDVCEELLRAKKRGDVITL